MAPLDPNEETEAEALRLALEGGGGHPLAELAEALRAVHAPTDLDPKVNEALVRAAIAAAPPNVVSLDARRRRGGLAIALATGFAVAASIAVVVRSSDHRASSREPTAAALVPPRSTESLLAEAAPSRASARIDVIARARTKDARENYFARRGVR